MIAPADVKVLFVGASLIEGWKSVATDLWRERIEPLRALNLGIPGEIAGQMLWRLQNNFLRGLAPKVIVLNIGANDTNLEPPVLASIVDDVAKAIRTLLPDAHLILCGLLPTSGRFAVHAPRHAQANALLAAKNSGTVFQDPTPLLVDDKERLHSEFTSDGIHLSAAGYEKWATQLLPAIDRLLLT